MRTKLIALLLLGSSFFMTAQKFELGKVSKEELEQKHYPLDESAPAAISFQTGKVTYEFNNGFTTVFTVKTRIKIYKKEGYDQANQVITYYSGQNSSGVHIKFSQVATYNLVDGKIEKTKLQDEGKFSNKVNRYWTQKKITMPNVKEGSVIEFEYTISQAGIGTPEKWNFQYRIPVAYSEFITEIPEYFDYNKSQKGFIFPKVTTEKVQYNPDFQFIRTTYIAQNMPAMKQERFVNNIENYTSSISHELSYINIPLRYGGSYFEPVANGWETITKNIYKTDDFDRELEKTKYFEDDIKPLIAGLNTNKEKVNAIFNFVKSRVKWNGETGFLCHYGVKDAYHNKIGNVAEINLMLIAMLRYAGVSTSPVLLSTRDNGIVLFPSIRNFNYVIGVVEADNQLLFLDATDENAKPGILPLRDLNWTGRLMRKENNVSYDVELTPKTLSKETTNMSATISADGTITGKTRHQLADYKALSFRSTVLKMNRDEYLESLESHNNAIEINQYTQENAADLDKPVVENYSFVSKNDAEIIEGKIYFTSKLFLTDKENPFTQEVRAYPIDFTFPFEDKYNISIEIPAGYQVESLPKSVNMVTGDDVGAFKYQAVSTDNKIQITITATMNRAIVPADYYEVLKDFYQKVIEKQNEKIVLIKT